ncbi:MAG: GntG family PLP-dependent aldolase [SAR202 cluster bacterium]|jgi:threonine aldolase|nr:GntG family PLP-dependent aldolase [SAR202 cluster bacterium]
MHSIDFRSDTKTLPTPEMREAIRLADLGDDVGGEDPSVNRLESMAAEMLGKEAAVLMTSGTMGNLIALLMHCKKGEQAIIGDRSHIYIGEGGGASALGGVVYRAVPNDDRGMIDLNDIRRAINPRTGFFPPTRLISIENTHNNVGGMVLTSEDMEVIAGLAKEYEVPLHLDGARIFNAAVYLGIPAAKLVKDADTVTFCLSKGLSAPVGSLLCGTAEAIDRARRVRKMLGAGMRQVGVIAAAGIVALETMVERLADDHLNARRLAGGLSQIPGITIEQDRVQTNLVFFQVNVRSQDEVVCRLGQEGVKVLGNRPTWRFVTHYGITSNDIDYALDVIDSVFKEFAS